MKNLWNWSSIGDLHMGMCMCLFIVAEKCAPRYDFKSIFSHLLTNWSWCIGVSTNALRRLVQRSKESLMLSLDCLYPVVSFSKVHWGSIRKTSPWCVQAHGFPISPRGMASYFTREKCRERSMARGELICSASAANVLWYARAH